MFRKVSGYLYVSLVTTLLLISVLLVGCGSADNPIKQVIETYNQSLPYAYESSTDILRQIATDREQGRLDIFKTQLADQHKIIKVKLVSLKIGKIAILPPKKKDDGQGKNLGKGYKQRKEPQVIDQDKLSQATVQTEEIWNYQYVDINTKKTLGDWSRISYQSTYTLVQIEGDWFVHDLIFKEKVL